MNLKAILTPVPLIAILRGLEPENALQIIDALYQTGFRAIEIPLNSPQSLKSIELARREFGINLVIGAGTVLTKKEVKCVHNAGGQFVVSPNADKDVIKATKSLGMNSMPGVNTPSEAFSALKSGADMLKLFPAESIPPSTVKAWRAVFPRDIWFIPVGGIIPELMTDYYNAGANGFGLGSYLFKPESTIDFVSKQAQQFISTYHAICSKK